MFPLALILLGAVELGPISGVSDADAQAALQEARAAAPAELQVELQIVGGVTRVLLVLELIANGDVDARVECSAPPDSMTEARGCIRTAMQRFAARTQPLSPLPREALVTTVEESPPIALYTLVGASGALAIAGTILAWYAGVAGARLEERPFVDDVFRDLERQERSYTISAGVVLGAAAVSLATALIWAALE